MADASPPDPYATAKANLRDTIKWLATTLAAVGGALLAGISITGLSGLEQGALVCAAICGAAGLLLILYTVGIMLSLLSSDVFYFSSLLEPRNPVAAELDRHARDVLPPQLPNVAAVIAARDKAISEANYTDYVQIDAHIGRVTNLAHFLDLRNALRNRQGQLFFNSSLAIVFLAVYAILASGKAKLGLETKQAVVFNPGPDWSSVASAYARTCGADKIEGVMTSQDIFPGWAAVHFSGPGKCAGLDMPIPASLLQLTGSKR